MRRLFGSLLAWLDDRTGWRGLRRHLLEEPLPAGTGWWFTVGSLLLFGLAVAAWQGGAGLAEGLATAAEAVQRCGGGRLTMLAADGERVAALVDPAEPMHLLEADEGVLLASEPHDDRPWRRLDDAAVEVGPAGLTQTRIRRGDA